jgi:hypothetical protein
MVMLALSAAYAQVNVPIGGGDAGIGNLKLVPVNGARVTLKPVANADAGKPAMKVDFQKDGDERRFIALEGVPAGNPAGAKAVALRYQLTCKGAKAARLSVMFWDKSGSAWFKVGPDAPDSPTFDEGRISVASLRKSSFSEGAAENIDWGNIGKVWIGVVIDGPATGSLQISRAVLTSEPYRPTAPLRITGDGAGQWNVGQDPAVKSTLTTPNEGPDGKACMKVEFQFPLGRHMYMTPTVAVPPAELDGYQSLRFTYKAALPAGVIGPGLLVTLSERSGAQYTLDAPDMPPPHEDWTTVTIPFAQFKLAGWSKDDNNHFDTDQISAVTIGCHGAANADDGKGTIWVSNVEFVP